MAESLSPKQSTERRRSSLRWQRVLLGLALITTLALAGFFFAYYKLVYYQRVAAWHLPESTQAALRLDVEQIVLYAPLRRHLFPVLVGPRSVGSNTTASGDAPRLERLKEITGINLGMDLREVLLARGATSVDWHLVVGGRFPDDPELVAKINEFLANEGWPTGVLSPDRQRLEWPLGQSLGRGDDGVLIVASNPAWLEACRARSNRFEELGLLRDGPGSFAWQATSHDDPLGLGLPAPVAPLVAGELERVRGFVRLEIPTSLEVQFTARERPDKLQRQLEFGLNGLRLAGTLLGENAEAWSFLGRAQTHIEPPRQVVLTAEWTEPEIDVAAAAVADWVGKLVH